jgi:MoaA/NifB/PqqE/SkfB family radical SAM enzyme
MKGLARKIFGFAARFQGKKRPEWIREYNHQRDSFPSPRICYSPDRTIFFGSDGLLYACCFNRTDSTGWYNSRSITPNEKARQDLSLRLQKNDFPRGCNICSSAVHSQNYAAVGASLYDHPGFGTPGFPAFLEFELSTRCNLDCIMCPDCLHSKTPGEIMDLRPLRKITGNYSQVKWAKFYGGEPFLTDAYFDI